ncbi:MAG: prepilin-type N-terminal cleavage/methylation domain-containing protein [Planctomycetota bacterium]|nr:prepilin-type N-terminal cleavage/methylation domain-containing protein [Planctomycetota bacterium]
MLTTSNPPTLRTPPQAVPLAPAGRAFTIVELLVVVAILVILVSFLSPLFLGMSKRATSTRCEANLHQISLAFAKRRVEGNQAATPRAGGSTYFPTSQEWPSVPYGNCKEPGIFACPSLGESIGQGDLLTPDNVLKQIVYYCRNRGFYIVLNDPKVQGYGHQHVAVLVDGKTIQFAVEDVDPPVTSIMNQGDDGAVSITLDTFPAEAKMLDCGCGEHNCLLYAGKPMFPQWEGKPADPPAWYDPTSIGGDGWYGYTGTRAAKLGQTVPMDGLRCDYGINKSANLMPAGENKAVVMDFDENSVDYEGADINTKLAKAAERHGGTLNVLCGGDAVMNVRPSALNPQITGIAKDWWKP